MYPIKRVLFFITVSLAMVGAASASPIFNFNPIGAMDSSAYAGFTAAGARWSSLFSDNITVNIDVGYSALGGSILAQAGSEETWYSYTDVRNRLTADATSADDATAVANLQTGPLSLLINRTADDPSGVGSPTPYRDTAGANNELIYMTNANAKALGLYTGSPLALDATITFNSSFTWDFDSSNGITGGSFDFVGIAAHEIGHALGFVSGVDWLDYNSPNVTTFPPTFYLADQFKFVSVLDLYRYSSESVANNSLDWTADTRQKYFSIDGGATNLAQFATGVTHGDGLQASHWKDSLGIGIMDPTAAGGEVLAISALDIQALDVIGYELTSPVPEPGTIFLAATALAGALAYRSRKRRSRT